MGVPSATDLRNRTKLPLGRLNAWLKDARESIGEAVSDGRFEVTLRLPKDMPKDVLGDEESGFVNAALTVLSDCGYLVLRIDMKPRLLRKPVTRAITISWEAPKPVADRSGSARYVIPDAKAAHDDTVKAYARIEGAITQVLEECREQADAGLTAWSGYCPDVDWRIRDGFIRRLTKLGYRVEYSVRNHPDKYGTYFWDICWGDGW